MLALHLSPHATSVIRAASNYQVMSSSLSDVKRDCFVAPSPAPPGVYRSLPGWAHVDMKQTNVFDAVFQGSILVRLLLIIYQNDIPFYSKIFKLIISEEDTKDRDKMLSDK